MTAKNTISASAASVSICAVGGSTPGISDDQLATRMKRNSVPISGTIGRRRRAHGVADLGFDGSTISSSAACARDGRSDRRRVSEQRRQAPAQP